MLLLASCQMPWGEKAAVPTGPQTKLGEEAKCLAGVKPVMSGFMDGSADPDQVSEIWTCFDNALGLFERKVRGDNPEYYTAREVANFFEDRFLDEDLRINDRLLVEVMRFKQLFVGGENQKITRDELRKLRVFARKMREISLDLLPQMRLLSLHWEVTGRDEFKEDFAAFENAKLVAQKAVLDLAAMIEPQKQSYEFAHFMTLLEELQVVFGTTWSATDSLKRMLPLLGELKGALTGTENTVIQAQDWRKFGQLGIRSYFLYLRYYYFFEKNPHHREDPELILVFGSADDAMGMLADILAEKKGGRLVREEVKKITRAISEVFPQFQVSDSLVDEVFKIKTLVLGGSADVLTSEDLSRGRTKLEDYRHIANLILENALILEGKWKPDSSSPELARTEFQKAEQAGKEIARRLGPLLESSYDIKNIGKLVKAYEDSFPPADPSQALAPRIDALMPLILAAPDLILGHQGSVIEPHEWSPFLDILMQAYGRFLEYDYFLKSESFFRQPGLSKYELWSESLAQLLESTLLARGGGKEKPISPSEIGRVMEALEDTGYWPKAVDRASVQALFPVIMSRLLTPPEARAKNEIQTSLSSVGVRTLMTEVRMWFGVQKDLDRILNAHGALSHEQLQALFHGGLDPGQREFYRLIESPIPLAMEAGGRLVINPKQQVAYDETTLRNLNLVRGLLRWVIRSYGELSQAQAISGLTEEQFDQAFSDVRSFVVKMGLLKPDDTSFATSRFFEGNLFTPYSDGDQFLNFSEAGSLSMLILSGLKVHKMTEKMIVEKCVQSTRSQTQYHVDCALEELRLQIPQAFSSMPGMAELFGQGRTQEDTALLNEVLKAAGWAPNEGRVGPMSDLALVPHVLQYIEFLFRRWDLNADGVLDRQEAMNAYPMFANLLRRVSNLQDEKWLRAAYAFILVKGKAPETFWEKFEFATGWVGNDQTWPIQADRYQVGRILGFIADTIRQGKTVNIVTDTKELSKQ